MDSERKVCLVCYIPTESTHLGIESCRACSTFFKRAVFSSRRYECKEGQRNCTVARAGKWRCRRCRYDRCVALGMEFDGPKKAIKRLVDQAMCDEPKSSSQHSLLSRIGRAYEINIANRREKELKILRGYAVRLPHPNYEVYASTSNFVTLTNRVSIDEAWIFLNNAYSSLRGLRTREKMELYKNYLINFNIVDSLYRTWKVWGALHKYSMSSVAACIDMDSPESWLGEEEVGTCRVTFIQNTRRYLRDIMAILIPSFMKAKITRQELFALFALMLCDTDMENDASEHLLSLLDSMRNEVLEDLQRYYKYELGLNNFSARICNIMTIAHTVRECSTQFQSFFRVQVALFDIWSTETQLRQFFLG